MNICLLGDSILDNATYTDGAPAVTDHLNRLLGGTGRATLIAVDGSVTAQVHRQVRELPAEVTDYANPIEPSGSGGEKIARAIGRTLSVEL